MKVKNNQNRQKLITAKLQSVKGYDELKKIYNSIEDQNRILRQDILGLKYKVDILMKRQNNAPTHFTGQDQTKTKQLQQLRKELKQNYKIMQELKKRSESLHQQKVLQQQVTNQTAKTNNILKVAQLQTIQTKKLISDLKNETQRLEKTIAAQQQQISRNKPKIEQYQQTNTQLRKKILSLRKIGTQKQYQSTKIMNSMYNVKHRYSKNQQLFLQIQQQKLSLAKKPNKKQKQEEINVKTLQQDVENLRIAVKKSQSQFVKNQSLKIKLKDRLQNKTTEDMRYFKELEQKKFKMIQEHNKLKKMWNHYLQVLEKNKIIKEIVNQEIQIQPYQQSQPLLRPLLRRDFAGILGGKTVFDDRQALKENMKSFIVGFYVYQFQHIGTSKNLLVGIRAIYDDTEASLMNNLPLPGQYLSKCKMSKYILNQGDFVKLFKIKYQAIENRILKIQIRTNKNNKYEFGDRRSFNDIISGQNVYGFDISIQEYPVCLFGSFNIIRSQWYMQSFGVQINDL